MCQQSVCIIVQGIFGVQPPLDPNLDNKKPANRDEIKSSQESEIDSDAPGAEFGLDVRFFL